MSTRSFSQSAPSADSTTKLLDSREGILGDRLIVSVNNNPYSQREIETYIIVKESVRADVTGPVGLVTAAGWGSALKAFIDDMVVQQEAHRLGSFQPGEQLLKLVREKISKKMESDFAFKSELLRLGVDNKSLLRSIHSVLRVEAYKRSKERQAAASIRIGDTEEDAGNKWFDDLKQRTMIRTFSGGEIYKRISPPDSPKATSSLTK